MSNVLIIGGGFAGLSSAVFLSRASIKVTLLEATPKLGGRAYSFYDKKNDEIIDNGQHIMMGCYNHTLDFLRTINAMDEIKIAERLRVLFVKKGEEKFELAASANKYPINLIKGILGYKALSIKNRLKVIDFFLDLVFADDEDLTSLTISEWMKNEKQNDEIIKALWEILAVGTLNAPMNKSSASLFCRILKEIFLTDDHSTKIILPKTGLSEMFCKKSADYLSQNDSLIKLPERILSFKIEDSYIKEVTTDQTIYKDIDWVISAVPFHSLEKILGDEVLNKLSFPKFEYSPILSVHVWLRNNMFTEDFYGLIDSKIHWLFNHKKHITLVTSSAFNLVSLSDTEIMKIFENELKLYFPDFDSTYITDYKVIKEKRATFIPTPNLEKERLQISSPCANLILAGDWTCTKLPATIEGAVKSGKVAADYIIKRY